jgi:ribonucleoside-triphosphate reductase
MQDLKNILADPKKIKTVRKRDGSLVAFDTDKIRLAIEKAGMATGEFGSIEATLLTLQSIRVLDHRFDESVVDIEAIQDIVEQALITANYLKTARAYIVYREQRRRLRQDKRTVVDVTSSINEYLERADWRVNANANQGYSLGGMILNISGKMTANYWLSHVYPVEVGQAHREGDIHIHDLDMLAGYCAGWSLKTLLREGLNGVPGKVEAGPPKHLSSAIGQMVNFLGTLQNEWAGAQAFSSFDTYLAPYVRIDNLSFDEVKQDIQEFIYNLNVPSRWGTQCVDESTQCLTRNGWKKYDEVSKKDKILTFNVKNNRYEYLTPSRVAVYDFEGEMYVLKNRTQEEWVTPGHRVLRKKFNTKDKYELIEIEKAQKFKSDLIFLNSWKTSSRFEMDDNLVKLLAWVVAEGNFDRSRKTARVSLFQSVIHKENLNEILDILKNLGLSYHLRKTGKSGFSNHFCCRIRLNKQGNSLIAKHASGKIVPKIIKTLSARQIRLFIDTYVKGDGHREKGGRVRIFTSNARNVDALQELCVLAGYGSTVSRRKENNVYVVNIIRNNETYIQKIEKKYYRGKVWCPTTKNGTFVARRNGKTFITGNTPFSNVTFDWVCPEDLRKEVPLIAGKEAPFKYGELQKEMDMINKAYIEVMTKGDHKGRVFTFPIPTYNITKDFDWDHPNCEILFEMTAKYGLPYFQNFINSDLKPNQIRSMCCRLQLDLRELLKRGNGLFGSAEQTGSLGVVTINCARLGYVHKGNEEALLKRLGELMVIAKTSLEIKRKVIQRHMDAGLFPYTKRYLGTLKNHFSTIGVNGVNECIRNFAGDRENITTPEGHALALRILNFARERLTAFQEETGHLYNLEASPAEGATYRFAKEDKKRFSDVLQAGTTERPYYTNSTQLPVNFTRDPFEALARQDELQTKYTGGTVLHLYMEERISSAAACKNLVKKSLEKFRLPYLTITPTFSVCPKHGYLNGEHEFCPKCDEELINNHPPQSVGGFVQKPLASGEKGGVYAVSEK